MKGEATLGRRGSVRLARALVAALLLLAGGAPAARSALAEEFPRAAVVEVVGVGADGAAAEEDARAQAVEQVALGLVEPRDAMRRAGDVLRVLDGRAGEFVLGLEAQRTETSGGVVRISARVRVDEGAVAVALAGIGVTLRTVARPASVAPPARPRHGDLPNLRFRTADPRTAEAELACSDAVDLQIGLDRGDVVFQVRMSGPWEEGMFTVVESWFDCDDDPGSGLDGFELRTRAAVGSRFRPNAYRPPAGFPAPLELVRASWLSPVEVEETRAGGRDVQWLNENEPLEPPELGTDSIRFRVPLLLFGERGMRYADSRLRFRMEVRTTCSDQPLAFEYEARGAGRAVEIDGEVEEWSGGPWAEDAVSELHPRVRFLDLESVAADHDAAHVHVRVDFEEPGIGRRPPGDADVSSRDVVHVLVEPLGERYAEPTHARIPGDRRAGRAGGASFAAGSGRLEVGVPRDPKQTQFRVSVWTEAVRRDEIGDRYVNTLSFGGGR